MRLYEHSEFKDAVIAASAHYGHRRLTEQLIEKDYYVTEALRLLAATRPTQIIFKGGTSLSKGWEIIQRFSEDIDLFLNPEAFSPPLSGRRIDRELKILRDAVSGHPGLEHMPEESKKRTGSARSDYFRYEQSFAGVAGISSRVLLEAGIGSGTHPTAEIDLSSYLASYLRETGHSLGADDETAFPMTLLHFRRTFVEKMFAIHSKVEEAKQGGPPIGTYARHYYDLYCLAQRPEVSAMLRSPEYAAIKADYDRISREFYADRYHYPMGMSFSNSQALFPPEALSVPLGADYREQCTNLCFGDYPDWPTVLGCFEEMKPVL